MGSILGDPPGATSAPPDVNLATNAETAIALACAGMFVLPIWPPALWSTKGATECSCPAGAGCPSPGKHPWSERGFFEHGLSQATNDPEIVRRAWELHPEASIAIAMAASSLVALDLDTYNGDDIKLAALVARLGPLPVSLEQISGSREGRHLIFQLPREADGTPMKCRGVIGGIVVRAKAYILVAPSRHAHGGRYEWVAGRGPTL